MLDHKVPECVQKSSVWDDDYGCYVATDGRCWCYTDDPNREGVSWRDGNNMPSLTAVWMKHK
jgi:hypothetical protein